MLCDEVTSYQAVDRLLARQTPRGDGSPGISLLEVVRRSEDTVTPCADPTLSTGQLTLLPDSNRQDAAQAIVRRTGHLDAHQPSPRAPGA